MKTVMAIVMMMALTLVGCQTSPQGGSMTKHEGFKISVPTFNTEVKQGDLQTITISLQRGSLFKQDVKLEVSASKGISVDPTSVMVKASESPDVLLQIAAPKEAALGEYPIVVKGTPETGTATSVGFTVKVVSP